MLNYTITLGEIGQAVSVIVGGILVFSQMREGLRNQGLRLENVEAELKKQTEILVSVARQDEQLKAITQRLQVLERTA